MSCWYFDFLTPQFCEKIMQEFQLMGCRVPICIMAVASLILISVFGNVGRMVELFRKLNDLMRKFSNKSFYTNSFSSFIDLYT